MSLCNPLYAVPDVVARTTRALAKLLLLRAFRCQLGEEGTVTIRVHLWDTGAKAYLSAISSPILAQF